MPTKRSTYAQDRISPIDIHYGDRSRCEFDPFKLHPEARINDLDEPSNESPVHEYYPQEETDTHDSLGISPITSA